MRKEASTLDTAVSRAKASRIGFDPRTCAGRVADSIPRVVPDVAIAAPPPAFVRV